MGPGHPSPRLLAIRLRDARRRYEEVLGRPLPEAVLSTLDAWDQVAWLERAIAEAQLPAHPGTYTPPAPYRVFRLVPTPDGPA